MNDEDPFSLARSESFEERGRAGVLLARRAGDAEVDDLLLELLVHDADTWVTEATAEALIQDGTGPALRVLLIGLATTERLIQAAETVTVQADYYGALDQMWDAITARDPEEIRPLRPALETLGTDSEEGVREQARQVLAWLDSR